MDAPAPIETPLANRLATAAPGTLTLGDATYLVAQPTDADFVTLRSRLVEMWKRRNASPLAVIAAALKGLPAAVQEIAIKEAVKLQAGNSEPTTDALNALLFDPEGAAFWVWLLCRKNHPTLTLESVAAAVTPTTVDDVLGQMIGATSLEDAAPNSAGGTGSA